MTVQLIGKNLRHRCDLRAPKVQFPRGSRGMRMPIRKILKSGPVRLHSQYSGAKIRVFAQNADIINLWLLGG